MTLFLRKFNVKKAAAYVFGTRSRNQLLLCDQLLDRYSLSSIPQDELLPNSHLSLLAMVYNMYVAIFLFIINRKRRIVGIEWESIPTITWYAKRHLFGYGWVSLNISFNTKRCSKLLYMHHSTKPL
jgi:hypothetical protein